VRKPSGWSVVALGLVGLATAPEVRGWTPEYNLTPAFSGPTGQPMIGIDATGRVHCAYLGLPAGQSQHIQYRYLDGAIWSGTTDVPSPNHKEYFVDFAPEPGGQLHMVGAWRYDGANAISIYYWYYDGSTWAGPLLIAGGSGTDSNNCTDPRIRRDRNGDLHVVWSQGGMVGGAGDIMYRKRQGGVWQTARNLSSNSTAIAYGSVAPDLAVDRNGTAVHVVWHDDSDGDGFRVWYTKNTGLGDPAAWLPSAAWTLISYNWSGGEDYGKNPRVFLDNGDNPSVFWTDKFGGSTNVMGYRRWTGSAWTAPANLGARWIQGGAFDRNNLLHFVYTQVVNNGPTELFYQTYDYSIFSAAQLVSAGASTSKVDFAELALDGYNNPHVIWEERKTTDGIAHVYYADQVTSSPLMGTLAGVVRDQAGAPVAGAVVSVTGTGGGITGSDGRYAFAAAPGTRDATASKDYYTSQTVAGVVITTGQTTTVNFMLATVPPEPVSGFTAAPGNRSVRLSWNCPGSGNFSAAMIRFSTAGIPAGPADGTLLADVAGTPGAAALFDHTGLVNGIPGYYAAFAHDSDNHFSAGQVASATPYGPGDLDHDGDVDQCDFGLLQNCLTGAYIEQTGPTCADARLDADSDVDQDDVAVFQGCISGPGVAADAACAN
jgi:hypothetical protein